MSNDRRYSHHGLILATCCLSLFVVSMDVTIVNVALPSIGKDLHASVTGLQWTLDGYTLVLASLLMLSGSTADRLGRRRVFQIGLGIFTLGSLLCSLAPTTGWLVAARVLQAVGGSMMNPVALSIITNTFTEKRARARAMGVWGAIVGVSLGFGPVIGGALTDTIGWRAIFWVNVPIGVAAIVLTALLVPESRAAHARRVDPVGQLLVILILAGLVFGLIEGPELGWRSPATLGAFAIAVLALVGLIRYEPRRREPLVDLRFFASAPFSAAILIAITTFGAWGAFLFANTLYLQGSRNLTPLQAGLCTMSAGIAIIIVSPLSGRLVGRTGTRLPLTIAGGGMAVAAALLALTVSTTTPIVLLIVIYTIFGAGFGMVNAPIANTAVSGMPNAQAGSAAAVASTGRQIGASLGVAIAGSVTGASTAKSVGASFAEATHPLWWVLVALGLTVAALGSVSNSSWAARSSKRIAPLLAEPAGDR